MIHHACHMEHFSPMFAWRIVSLQPREILVIVLAEKATITPNILLEHYVPAFVAGTSFTCIRSPKKDAQQFCYKLSHEELSSVMK